MKQEKKTKEGERSSASKPRPAKRAPARKSNLALRLKSIRKRSGLSLTELSSLTGISRSTLYKVENSGVSLTYDKLVQLSTGLNINVGEFFRTGDDSPEAPVVTARFAQSHLGSGEPFETDIYKTIYLCGQISNKRMVPALVQVKAHSLEEFGELTTHPGEEMNVVIEGVVEFHTGFYEPVTLVKDDVVYIDATMPHAMISLSEEDALVITIATDH